MTVHAEAQGQKLHHFIRWQEVLIIAAMPFVFWVGDSAVDYVFFQEEVFLEEVFSPTPRELWTRSSGAVILLTFGSIFLLVLSDLRRKQQSIVRESESRLVSDQMSRERLAELEHIYNTTPVGLCLLDTNLRFLRINNWLADINGVSQEDHLGRTLREIVPEIAESMEEVYTKVIETGVPVVDVLVTAATPAHPDAKRHYLANYYPLKSEDGAVWGLSSMVRDVTERQKSEERLRNSREELRNLASHLQSAREEERASLAREIHDELGSMLTRLNMDLAMAHDRLSSPLTDSTREKLQESIDAMSDMTRAIIKSIQQIAYRLRPSMLDDLGLWDAMDWEAKDWQSRTGIDCDLERVRDDLEFPKDLATTVFRVFQEALTNVSRHADATRVEVSLDRSHDNIHLGISDNGHGIAETELDDPHSFGIIGMRERAFLLGGELKIRGTRGKGTEVLLTVPLPWGARSHD